MKINNSLKGADTAILKKGFPTQSKREGAVPFKCIDRPKKKKKQPGGPTPTPWIRQCLVHAADTVYRLI